MNIKFLTLSAATSAVLMAATPMVPASMSTDNGGAKSAIDAYSDGGGVVIINQAGDTKFDNSAMNGLVFKYGQTAEDSGATLKTQISVLSADATAAEKAISVKFDLAKVVINPPVNGTTCDDGNPQTVTDVWNNGLCGGNNIENQNCDDDNIQTINDKYHSGVCGGTNVEGLVCDDTDAKTINDLYHNGVCAGTNVEGQTCNDTVSYTYADKYINGVCTGETALACKDIKTSTGTSISGAYTIKPAGSGPYSVYCDMVTDGGGWTLAMKVTGATLGGVLNGRDTTTWFNGTLTGSTLDVSATAALGPAYTSVPFNSVMIRGLTDSTKRLSWQHPTTYANLNTVVSARTSIRNGVLLGGSVQSLQYRSGCGTGVTPPSVYYGFYVADNGVDANTILGVNTIAWGGAVIGYGSNTYASGYNVSGGVGFVGHTSMPSNKWDINRHIHGYGDGCTTSEWGTSGNNGTQSFLAHGVFIK